MAKAAKASAIDDVDMQEVEARLYEICVLYPYPMNQKEEGQLLKAVEAIFSEAGAKLMEKDVWGRRGLAYPIKGSTEGSVIMYYYEANPLAMREVDEALRIVPGVLRHLIVKPPKGYQIVKFSQTYEQWMKQRETVDEQRERQKEEALKEKVVAKAKRQVKKVDVLKKEETMEKPAMSDEKLTEELEKIISDDQLDL